MRQSGSQPFNRRFIMCEAVLLVLIVTLTGALSRLRADTGICGDATTILPFTDVSGSFAFCSIAELYFQGITGGTSPTTYGPANNVTRDQMAIFLSRTLDFSLKRGSRRAALQQFWTTAPQPASSTFGITDLGGAWRVASDGTDIWVAEGDSGHVSRVRASDGASLNFWTIDSGFRSEAVLCARGRVFVLGNNQFGGPGRIYRIDQTVPPGPARIIAISLGVRPSSLAYDGANLWSANETNISKVPAIGGVSNNIPYGPFDRFRGILYDGANIWVTRYDASDNSGELWKLDGNGNLLQAVTVGTSPYYPAFDGRNIWVPNYLNSTVTVVRASDGTVLATLSGNGLQNPVTAAFDGERILVTNTGSDGFSLWKATDLTPIGNFTIGEGAGVWGACSDGLKFWTTLMNRSQLMQY